MKNALKKAISVLLVAVMVFGTAPLAGFVGLDLNIIKASAEEEIPTSGTCGENLTWTLDTETGELVISGTGGMLDYSFVPFAPWHSYHSLIKSVTICNGVTSIGDYAFVECNSLTSVTIPDSVTSIGFGAFAYCNNLVSIAIPDSVTSIGQAAFSACSSLEDVKIGNGVKRLEVSLFVQCKKLKSITMSKSVESVGFNAFLNCINIENVYYEGSKADWGKIEIEDGNEHLTSAKIYYGISDSSSTYVPDNTPGYDSSVVDTYLMPTPTQTTISYGDSIVLHVDPSKIPASGYVEWYPSNGNFSSSVSSDGTTCTITPDKKGDTTFTAIVYDSEGNVVSADTQAMTSKAGFFDKIIAFFKKLFGLTKTIPEALKGVY